MNKALLLLSSSVILLAGCQSMDSDNKTAEQRKPQFGQPESTIPWNKPEQWEQAGVLGSVPGVTR